MRVLLLALGVVAGYLSRWATEPAPTVLRVSVPCPEHDEMDGVQGDPYLASQPIGGM